MNAGGTAVLLKVQRPWRVDSSWALDLTMVLRTAQWAHPVGWDAVLLLSVSLDFYVGWSVVHYHLTLWSGMMMEVAKLSCSNSSGMGCHMLLDLPLVSASFAGADSFGLLMVGVGEDWVVEVLIVVCLLGLLLVLDGHLRIFLFLFHDLNVITLSQRLYGCSMLVLLGCLFESWSLVGISLLLTVWGWSEVC